MRGVLRKETRTTLAQLANVNPFFAERVKTCQTKSGKLPNFVTVDFYSIGDVFSVVDRLNGLFR